MTTNADILCEALLNDNISNGNVLKDFWGDNINDEDKADIIFNVYKHLHIKRGVSSQLFYKILEKQEYKCYICDDKIITSGGNLIAVINFG